MPSGGGFGAIPIASCSIVLAAMSWGFIGPAMALLPAGTHPETVSAARIGVGAVGFLVVLSRRPVSLRPLAVRGVRGWLGIAVAANLVTHVTLILGLAWAGIAVGAVLHMGLCPIFTAVLERVVAAGRLTGRWLAVTAVAVAGCVALVLDGDSTQGPRFCLGIAAAVTSALAYSAFTVAGAKVIGAGHPSTAVMAVVFCGTALGLTPAFLIWPVGWMATPAGASVAFFLGLVATTGAYVLFGFGLRHVPARVAATLVLAEPATAAAVAVAVLGERLGWLGSTGLLAVFAALVAMVLPNSSSSRATSRPTARHRCETARRPVPAGVTAAQAQTLAGMITAATMHQDARAMLDDIAAFLHAAARTAEFGPRQDADPAQLWARIEARTR